MTVSDPPEHLFGIPLRQARTEAAQLLARLGEAWETQYQRMLGPLDRDLERMHASLFNPVAREFSIRKEITKLVLQGESRASLPGECGEAVAGANALTPEGRVMIELLEEVLADQDGPLIDFHPDHVVRAEHLLRVAYRDWSRQRIANVGKLLADDDSPLLYAPIGFVLAMMLEGAIGEENALEQRPATPAPAQDAVEAFVSSLHPESKADPANFALYGGYAVSEARRRLPQIELVGPSSDRRLFIRNDGVEEVMGFVRHALARRGVAFASVAAGVEAMAESYGRLAPDRVSAVAGRMPFVLDALRAGGAETGGAAVRRRTTSRSTRSRGSRPEAPGQR